MSADLLAWIQARPLVSGLLVWLAATLFGFLFKPRTPAEYDKLPPRVAAALQLLGAVFGDGRKILVALTKILTGRSEPPPGFGVEPFSYRVSSRPPPPPAAGYASLGPFALFLSGLTVSVALGAILFACGGPPSPTPGEVRVMTFSGQLELCLQRHSDDPCGYIACRHEVQAKYGQPISGVCLTPPADAGADGAP